MLHKDVDSVLISQEKLEKIVKSLAKQIEKDYNDKEFMMVGLLKGSVVFMADLMKKINLDFSIDFIVASSYGSGTESSGLVRIVSDLTQPVDGKDILIVEDIVDSGNTLNFVMNYLMTKGARSVKVCTPRWTTAAPRSPMSSLSATVSTTRRNTATCLISEFSSVPFMNKSLSEYPHGDD